MPFRVEVRDVHAHGSNSTNHLDDAMWLPTPASRFAPLCRVCLPQSSPRLTAILFCSRPDVRGSSTIAASEFAVEGRKVAEAGTVGEGTDA